MIKEQKIITALKTPSHSTLSSHSACLLVCCYKQNTMAQLHLVFFVWPHNAINALFYMKFWRQSFQANVEGPRRAEYGPTCQWSQSSHATIKTIKEKWMRDRFVNQRLKCIDKWFQSGFFVCSQQSVLHCAGWSIWSRRQEPMHPAPRFTAAAKLYLFQILNSICLKL